MEGALRRSLRSQAQHTHTLWKTIHGLSNRAPPHTLNTSITFHNKIATTPKHIANEFTNTVKHATYKTNRHINRATHNIQGYNITLTTSQAQEAIKQSKNNNSQSPDKINIRHLNTWAAGSLSDINEGIISGQMPNKIVVGCVRNIAYNGVYINSHHQKRLRLLSRNYHCLLISKLHADHVNHNIIRF